MKRTKRYKFKRFLQSIVVRCKKFFKMDRKSKYPKDMTSREKAIASIFLNILHEPGTLLDCEAEARECYLRSELYKISIFLEPGNIIVINTGTPIDTKISVRLEIYLTERFIHEASKRRKMLRKDILDNIEASLNDTLDNINHKKNKN